MVRRYSNCTADLLYSWGYCSNIPSSGSPAGQSDANSTVNSSNAQASVRNTRTETTCCAVHHCFAFTITEARNRSEFLKFFIHPSARRRQPDNANSYRYKYWRGNTRLECGFYRSVVESKSTLWKRCWHNCINRHDRLTHCRAVHRFDYRQRAQCYSCLHPCHVDRSSHLPDGFPQQFDLHRHAGSSQPCGPEHHHQCKRSLDGQ